MENQLVAETVAPQIPSLLAQKRLTRATSLQSIGHLQATVLPTQLQITCVESIVSMAYGITMPLNELRSVLASGSESMEAIDTAEAVEYKPVVRPAEQVVRHQAKVAL